MRTLFFSILKLSEKNNTITEKSIELSKSTFLGGEIQEEVKIRRKIFPW